MEGDRGSLDWQGSVPELAIMDRLSVGAPGVRDSHVGKYIHED